MAALDLVHLHVHSSYSLLEGALTIARLAELAKADKHAALALTDTDNMFGVLEFSEKMAGSGIQPIVGCALAIDFGDTEHGARNGSVAIPRERIVLLAAREAGYRSLMQLNSRGLGSNGWTARPTASSRSPAGRAGRSMPRLRPGKATSPARGSRPSIACSATGFTSNCSGTARPTSASASRC